MINDKQEDTQPSHPQQPAHNPQNLDSLQSLMHMGKLDSWAGIRFLKETYFGMMNRDAQCQFLRHILEREPDYFYQVSPVTLFHWAYHLYRQLNQDQLVQLHLLSQAIHHLKEPNPPISAAHLEIEMIGMLLYPDLTLTQDADQSHESRTKYYRQELERIQKELADRRVLEKLETIGGLRIKYFEAVNNGE